MVSSRAKAQRKLASDQRQLVAQAQKTWQEFLAAEKTLQLKPDDPAASLIAGRWYCLQRGDWERGLPCLARSSDSRLSELARREAAAAGASAMSRRQPIRVLAIETSCDETAASVVQDGRYALSNVVASQVRLHAPYGGVFPELASRQHLRDICGVVERALAGAGV